MGVDTYGVTSRTRAAGRAPARAEPAQACSGARGWKSTLIGVLGDDRMLRLTVVDRVVMDTLSSHTRALRSLGCLTEESSGT